MIFPSGKKLKFGKHKGQTIDHVAQFDPGYIDWMYAEKLCGIEEVNARDQGKYKRKKLPDGYAIVF